MKKLQGLRRGDTVALLAPASAVKEEYCDGAERWLIEKGFKVKRYPSACGGTAGSYSASATDRRGELCDALADPGIKGILCARGGYGCIHLLEEATPLFGANPKWIIGFSDVSALHAMAQCSGFCSIHAPMAKHLAESPCDEVSSLWLQTLVSGRQQTVSYPTAEGSIAGEAEGVLIGGNLAVLNSLAATPWDILSLPLSRPSILVMEDISEAIYAVERMVYRLHLSGVLGVLKGIAVGQFTEYRPDRNYVSVEEMLAERFREWNVECPVAFRFPVGHVADNRPLLMGSECRLTITSDTTVLEPV